MIALFVASCSKPQFCKITRKSLLAVSFDVAPQLAAGDALQTTICAFKFSLRIPVHIFHVPVQFRLSRQRLCANIARKSLSFTMLLHMAFQSCLCGQWHITVFNRTSKHGLIILFMRFQAVLGTWFVFEFLLADKACKGFCGQMGFSVMTPCWISLKFWRA